MKISEKYQTIQKDASWENIAIRSLIITERLGRTRGKPTHLHFLEELFP